jgi:sulfotransferase family protein
MTTVAAGSAPASGPELRTDEPVIVLTCARSGSTLLRFVLDSHPALACPAETAIVDLCSRMGILAELLASGDPAAMPAAADATRTWVRAMFGAYLSRAGKSRWCEKSLGSAAAAEEFIGLFPKARFICLYRSSMDVVDSVHEACPWGLHGYGLEPFAAAHSGNTVAAVADYWVCQTRPILEFEQAHPEICLRVRYEDLTAEPAATARRIFAFLGEPDAPVVAAGFLTERRDLSGPADHKIWETTRVHADSVGRGIRVPVAAVPPAILALVNELHGELGYGVVDETWNDAAVAHVLSQPRDEADDDANAQEEAAAVAAQRLDELESLLFARLAQSLPRLRRPTGLAAGSAFRISAAVRLPGGALVGHWRVDLTKSTCTPVDAEAASHPALSADLDEWAALGDADSWIAVLTGQRGLAAALRDGSLRVAGRRDEEAGARTPGPRRADDRVTLLTWLIPPSAGTGDNRHRARRGDIARAGWGSG